MNNPLYIGILVNLLLWSYVLLCIFRSRQVVYECLAGAKYVIILFFFVIGFSIYMGDIQGYGLYNFLSIGSAGIVYYLVKSGIGTDGFYILGRRYRYDSVSNVKIETLNKKMGLRFDYHKRSHYLFVKPEQVKELKGYLDQYYYQKKER